MEPAEVEEAVDKLAVDGKEIYGILLKILTVINLVNGCVDVLMSEEFQCEGKKVGVEKKLAQVFEFEDI